MAIKISGSTIIDDSRVVVNADKIGIGTPSPNRDLEILSTNATGIGVSAASAQATDTNKAISVYNTGITSTFAVSYKGRVDAEEYYGTFKGNIDPGVPITNAGKIQIHHNSANDFFNVPFFSAGLTDNTFQDVQYDNTNSLEYNPSLGNLRVTSGAGITGLILRTSNNTFDRAIAFQNSGNNYTGYIGMANIGSDDADMVFGVDFTNEAVADNVTERLRITNAGITSVKGEDDQDNFIVDVAGTQFAVHTDATDGELSLRAQDGTSSNNSKFMTFFTQESGSAAAERVRIASDGKVGIGTADPGQKLHISGDGAGQNTLRIDTSGSAISIHDHSEFIGFIGNDSGKLFINAGGTQDTLSLRTNGVQHLRVASDGNIGIGTANTNPSSKLHVLVDGVGQGIRIANQENLYPVASTGYSDIRFSFRDYLNGGSSGAPVIIRGQSHNASATSRSSKLIFLTSPSDGTNTPTEKMRIEHDGNVGIGTNNPSYRLQVQSDGTSTTAAGNIVARFQSFGSGRDATIQLSDNVANSATISMLSSALIFKQAGVETLQITSGGILELERGSAVDAAIDIKTTSTSGASRIRFVESGTSEGELAYSHNNDQLELVARSGNQIAMFTNGASEKLRINLDGDLLRGGGGQDIGSSGAPWDKVYANEFIGLVNTTQENVTTGNLLVTGISTFVGVATFHAVGIGTDSVDSAKLEINVGSAVTALDIQGSEGQLFSVTNNLTTGSIFAVNDVSGTPSINVDADGTIQLAPFLASDKVGIGTTNPAHKLDVIGDAFVNGTLFLDDTATQIEKITGADGHLDLYADSSIRLYESDADRLGITFDINQTATDRDVRIHFMGESTTYLHSPASNTLGFKINNNDTLRLADSKVGVNVTDPHCALDVRNASGTDPLVELHHSNIDTLGEVIRIGRVDSDSIRFHSIKAKHSATANSNQLSIFMHDGTNTGGTGLGQTEAVRIRGDGKIGIGTDNITQRLVVEDSIQLRSTLYNTILFFQRIDTGANGWIGIPSWNPDALYIFGPTSNSNEVAAAYSQAKWTFSTGGNTALTIKDGGSVNIGGDYDQTTRKLKVTGDVEVASGTLYANVSGAITPTGDVDISGDLTVSGQIGIATDNANRPLDVYGNVQFGSKSTADAELVIGRDGSGNRNAYIDFIGDNTYTDYGLRMIRKNNGANAESQIAHRGTGNLSLATQEAADMVFSTSNTNRLIIKADGKIGIGTVSPVVLTADEEEAIQITTDIRNSNADNVYGIRVDVDDDDDSITVDNDRERGSAKFVFDGNSDQGDTNHELRIRNIHSDINCNKDYDQVMGFYADVNTNHTSGTITSSYGLYADARHTNSGTISNVYGVLAYGRAETNATSAIGSIYGVRGIARHAGSNSGNTSNLIGVRGDAQIREGSVTRRTATNAYSFYADLHNDNIETPSEVVSGRKAMYYGDVSGSTNVTGLGRIYGLYLQDATDNYLSGNLQVVGVATVATLNATTINATTITGTVEGSAERITLTNQSGDDTCNIVFAQSATGNQLPHTNANLTFNATTGNLSSSIFTATGGTVDSGTETDPTNVAIMLEKGDYIYTNDGTNSKRRLIGKTSGEILEVGHSNTALINEIRMLPGTGFFSVYQGSNEKFRVQSDALNFKTPIRYGSDTSTLLTSHVYVRGTAHNNSGVEATRVVTLNGEDIIPNDSTGIGLVLVVLNAGSGISTSSITRYNTHNGGTTPPDNMATAITAMTRDQIGIIASYDACMDEVNDNLRTAAQKVGLFKLAGISGHTGSSSRLGYAAVFRGTSNDTAAEVNDAIEVVQAYSANAGPPTAVISTDLTSFGSSGRDAGITGAHSVSAIVAPSGSYEPPLLQGKSTSASVSHLTIGAGVHLLPSGSASNDSDSNGVDLGGGSNYLRQIYVRKINADSIVGGLAPSGNVDISGNLDVDGHTDLDNVNIAGVTTFASDIEADVIRGRSHSSNSFLDFDDDSVVPHMTGTNVTSLKSISGLNLVFDTNNNDSNGLTIGSGNATSANMNVHMVVTAAGDVGIGTINPTGGNALTNNTSTLAVGTLKANTISGTVTNSTNATNADHVKVTDNENTNETNLITFVENAQDTTGNHGLEMDGNLTYNPAYGRLGATVFQGSGAGLENLDITAIDLDGGTATTSLANADLFLVRDDDASTLTGSDGKNRKVTFQTLSNAISSSIGGITDVAVTQEGRSAPCYLPITVTGTSTKTIGIATESNAFGAKYVQVTEPTGSSICDGDLWYDTSTEPETTTTDIVEANKFFQNPTSLTQTTTFPASGTKNGGVFGPYEIASGVTFTISSGSTFTIL